MNAVDILKYGHQTVLRTLDGLPEAQWETGGVCGVWSVKKIIHPLTQNDSQHPTQNESNSASRVFFQACGVDS
jgi:hypothetical protein